LTDTGENLDWT